ncbi:MAG TPA: cbb3-type cytochrome oxidase assembly protein CcoS [Halieaceae bacterium]|nr:cbb3-type cytochrome oxidase assembly protein CcoS [Halieaceae bacterium]
MDSLYLLIPVALIFVAVAVKLLLWAIDSGQYDDLDKEGWRILADDDKPAHRADGQREGDGPGADSDDPGEEHGP